MFYVWAAEFSKPSQTHTEKQQSFIWHAYTQQLHDVYLAFGYSNIDNERVINKFLMFDKYWEFFPLIFFDDGSGGGGNDVGVWPPTTKTMTATTMSIALKRIFRSPSALFNWWALIIVQQNHVCVREWKDTPKHTETGVYRWWWTMFNWYFQSCDSVTNKNGCPIGNQQTFSRLKEGLSKPKKFAFSLWRSIVSIFLRYHRPTHFNHAHAYTARDQCMRGKFPNKKLWRRTTLLTCTFRERHAMNLLFETVN